MAPAPVVAGYSHVAIAVDDLESARTFYCGVFGFEEVRRPDFGFPGMWLAVGSLQLHFVETDELPTPGKGFP
ncbi:MAG TPA: VOC family protein, partial [Acidimicrobiales bacterium]|nr:VOC family protein [Acidimicrobiales bacterium]